MNLLYVWDGARPLPPNRADHIAATMAVYPDANYFVISKLTEFYSERFTIIPWMDVAKRMMIDFTLRRFPYHWNNYMIFSDWARFWWLGNHGDTLYLDTDCRMLKPYDFSGGQVVYPDKRICLIYSPPNENKEYLLKVLDDQGITMLMNIPSKFKPDWSRLIPEEYYRHGK